MKDAGITHLSRSHRGLNNVKLRQHGMYDDGDNECSKIYERSTRCFALASSDRPVPSAYVQRADWKRTSLFEMGTPPLSPCVRFDRRVTKLRAALLACEILLRARRKYFQARAAPPRSAISAAFRGYKKQEEKEEDEDRWIERRLQVVPCALILS
ncbi:hypothetical protein Trydic_g5286 [Trypoxylus dichotomus]